MQDTATHDAQAERPQGRAKTRLQAGGPVANMETAPQRRPQRMPPRSSSSLPTAPGWRVCEPYLGRRAAIRGFAAGRAARAGSSAKAPMASDSRGSSADGAAVCSSSTSSMACPNRAISQPHPYSFARLGVAGGARAPLHKLRTCNTSTPFPPPRPTTTTTAPAELPRRHPLTTPPLRR